MMQNLGFMDNSTNRRLFDRKASNSKNIKQSNTIRDHLGSLMDNVPYFEGLPFIEYEHRENTWGNVFKGKLLSQ